MEKGLLTDRILSMDICHFIFFIVAVGPMRFALLILRPSYLLIFSPYFSFRFCTFFFSRYALCPLRYALPFRLPHSDFPLPNSHFRIPTSHFRLPTSAFRLSTSAFPLPHSSFKRSTILASKPGSFSSKPLV